MRSQIMNRNRLILIALALLAAACSSTPATQSPAHPPAPMLNDCIAGPAEFPPCEPAQLYYPGAYYPYGALYPGMILVPQSILATPAVPAVPVAPAPVPKPPPSPPKPHKPFKPRPRGPKEHCKIVNGLKVCP